MPVRDGPGLGGKAPIERYSQLQWEQQRPIITQLYSQENRKLNDVCVILAQQYGFKATERMLKHRIRQWHLDKKQKGHEMRAIVRISRQRKSQGKESRFLVRGREVDTAEISRYFRRKGISELDDLDTEISSAPPTPPDIVCYTPVEEGDEEDDPFARAIEQASHNGCVESPTSGEDDRGSVISVLSQERACSHSSSSSSCDGEMSVVLKTEAAETIPALLMLPQHLKEMECVLASTRDFLEYTLPLKRNPVRPMGVDPVIWRNDFLQASYLFRASDTDVALAEFSSVYDRIHGLLKSQSPVFLAVLLGLLCFPMNALDFTLSQQLFRYIQNMAKIVLGTTHPITLLLSYALTSEQRGPLAILALQKALHIFERTFGRCHLNTLELLEQLADGLCDLERYEEVIVCRKRIVEGQEATDGKFSPYTCWALLDLSRVLVRAGQDDRALALIEEAFQRADELPPRPRAEIRCRGLGRMAFIYERQGRPATARMMLQTALDLGYHMFVPEKSDSKSSKQSPAHLMDVNPPLHGDLVPASYSAQPKRLLARVGQLVLSKPDATSLSSHLHRTHQGRAISFQTERNNVGSGDPSISRNFVTLFFLQSQSTPNR